MRSLVGKGLKKASHRKQHLRDETKKQQNRKEEVVEADGEREAYTEVECKGRQCSKKCHGKKQDND